MKKNLSIIYQYYLLKGIKYSYLDALLTMVYFIGIHIFITQEIILMTPIKKNSFYISILRQQKNLLKVRLLHLCFQSFPGRFGPGFL